VVVTANRPSKKKNASSKNKLKVVQSTRESLKPQLPVLTLPLMQQHQSTQPMFEQAKGIKSAPNKMLDKIARVEIPARNEQQLQKSDSSATKQRYLQVLQKAGGLAEEPAKLLAPKNVQGTQGESIGLS
jgi:hypothetical protein